MSSPPLSLRTIRTIAEIDATAWDACANPDNPTGAPRPRPDSLSEDDESLSQKETFNPFICHRFLSSRSAARSALEKLAEFAPISRWET